MSNPDHFVKYFRISEKVRKRRFHIFVKWTTFHKNIDSRHDNILRVKCHVYGTHHLQGCCILYTYTYTITCYIIYSTRVQTSRGGGPPVATRWLMKAVTRWFFAFCDRGGCTSIYTIRVSVPVNCIDVYHLYIICVSVHGPYLVLLPCSSPYKYTYNTCIEVPTNII